MFSLESGSRKRQHRALCVSSVSLHHSLFEYTLDRALAVVDPHLYMPKISPKIHPTCRAGLVDIPYRNILTFPLLRHSGLGRAPHHPHDPRQLWNQPVQNACPAPPQAPTEPYWRCAPQADAVLHFGTHGSLEFMPGKQVGMSDICYPDSLIGSIPNLYYYAANNPSEATIAKRRSYANTISYLTPPAENAGLYKGLKVRLHLHPC